MSATHRSLIAPSLRALGAILCFWQITTSPVEAESEVDPATLAEIKQLIVSRVMRDEALPKLEALRNHPDRAFAEREIGRLRTEMDDRVRQQIRTRPGLKPYLFALLERAYRGPNPHPYQIPRILEALAMRDDLKPEDVEIVRREVAHNFANPILDYEHKDERSLQEHYLGGSMAVLARNLTPESEDLLLQGLTWPHLDAIKVMAARALADAGVVRSLPAMQATYDRLKAIRHPYAEDVLQDLQKLKARQSGSTVAANVSTMGTPIPSPSRIGSTEGNRDFSLPRIESAWLRALGIATLAFSAFLFRRRGA